MTLRESLEKWIFEIRTPDEFNAVALEIFRYQYERNPVYRRFTDLITKGDLLSIRRVEAIPHLPIEAFKSHEVISADEATDEPALVFTSSGTGGSGTSRHFVARPEIYERAFLRGFEHIYGSPKDYRILALLPSYLEREGSSLIYMVDRLIRLSGHPESGFFLSDRERLRRLLEDPGNDRTLLIGVSFALLDLVEEGPMRLQNTVVMETGGMKGRRKEITRQELHRRLTEGLGVKIIHSEYGMTELLSQAYSTGEGHFETPPRMRFSIRDVNDPLSPAPPGRTGGLNVIDLANIDTCCFIATSDLARESADGKFEILGRFDFSDTRGCNLMVP